MTGDATTHGLVTRALLWHYRARPVYVVDGDTIDVEIDCGFGVQLGLGDVPVRLRLARIDAPELYRGPPAERAAGGESRDYVRRWLAEPLAEGAIGGWPLVLRTSQSDSFGRWLAEVWRSDGANLSDDLVADGHARVWVP